MTNARITSNARRVSQGGEVELEARAGPCVEGKFHRWGEQQNRRDYIAYVRYDIACFRCARVRVVQYGKRGNRPIGYFTRLGKAP